MSESNRAEPYSQPMDSGDPNIPVCDACIKTRNRWIDEYPLIRPLSIASHAGWDDTPTGIAWRRRRQYDDWANTIRWHYDFITKFCRQAEHWKTEREEEAA